MNYVPFTQTEGYLSWHKAIGTKTFYKEFYDVIDTDVAEERDFQIDGEREYVEKKVVYAKVAAIVIELRIGKVLYVPYGPYFSEKVGIVKKNRVIKYLHELAQKEGCVFVRLENAPEKKLWPSGEMNSAFTPTVQKFFSSLIVVRPPIRTFRHEGIFQPRVEWWKDLAHTEEEIYNSLYKNHRYSVRKFEKDGGAIQAIQSHFAKELDTVFSLLEETSKRDEFLNHDREYVKAILQSLDDKKFDGYIMYSQVEGKINGFALVIIHDNIANYLLGGSTNFRRDTGSSVHLIYKAIMKAKELGAAVFNFGGITSNGYGKQSLEGVTNFKKQFGGYVKFHGNFLDIPLEKMKYYIYLLRKMF